MNKERNVLFKCLVARCHSFFIYFSYFITYMHILIQSHLYNTFIHRHSLRPLSISSSLVCSVGEPPCGAEPRIELGPALQQADALPNEPRRTIANEPRRAMQMSHAHHPNVPRRTIRNKERSPRLFWCRYHQLHPPTPPPANKLYRLTSVNICHIENRKSTREELIPTTSKDCGLLYL
jgi:hypothetical protein